MQNKEKKNGRLWFRCTEDSLHSIQPNFTPVSNHVNYKGVSTLTSVQSSVSPHNFCIISYGFCSTYGKYHQNYYTLPCELTLIKKRMLLFNAWRYGIRLPTWCLRTFTHTHTHTHTHKTLVWLLFSLMRFGTEQF